MQNRNVCRKMSNTLTYLLNLEMESGTLSVRTLLYALTATVT